MSREPSSLKMHTGEHPNELKTGDRSRYEKKSSGQRPLFMEPALTAKVLL